MELIAYLVNFNTLKGHTMSTKITLDSTLTYGTLYTSKVEMDDGELK